MGSYDPSSVDVPLSLFSSLDTELSPACIPEGISPDNQDIVYLPGSASTRPALQSIFASGLESSSAYVTYEKSFVLPNGNIKNLYMVSSGNLYVEDETNSPGTVTLLFASTASYASSVTAFGREYIALSDGVHGADVPLQYDGTNLWRVTQDGPGTAPLVTSIALPASTLANTVATPVTVALIQSAGPYVVAGVTYYSQLVVYFTGIVTTFSIGENVTISGSSVAGYNVSGTISSLGTDGAGNTLFAIPFNGTASGNSVTGSVTGPAATLYRSGNTVTAGTAAAHSLQIGYQVQITGIPASTIGTSISSLVINNQDFPGQATVTTATAHGLLPNNRINILNVNSFGVGTAITNVAFAGDTVTITTSAAHGLQIGSEVLVTAVTNTTVNGQWLVTTVPTTTTFTYAFVSAITAYSAADTGSVTYIWPLANVDPSQNYFTVLTCPSPTVFTIGISYPNGSWSGGTITLAWDGIFYVTGIPSTTSFQYQQYGPNSSTTSAGTATPYGQAAPGIHQVQQCFLWESGGISEPSPPSTFIANGGQYLSVSNLAIGPANTAGRILLFTGSGGAYFFYIPVPAQANGLIVSTATQINDNTTTAIVLDFADDTLYAATACSIPGNNLAEQVVLGPCAGFFTYASRLQAWGQRNKIQNLLNMGFDGGYISTTPTIPTGWTPLLGFGSSALVAGRPSGFALQLTTWLNNADAGTVLYQSGYLDAYGGVILLPNTQYSVRLWIKADFVGTNGAVFVAAISSLSLGFYATAIIPNASLNTTGAYYQANFNALTPATIPTDMSISIEAIGTMAVHTLTLDEVEIIYTQQPYLQNTEILSYANNPEGFDGITGILGPEDDETPIQNHGVVRNSLYLVTGGSVHETSDNGQTEPNGWTVAHVADNCGAWSIASVARNPQGVGSAGKEWMMWSGPDGAQIFTGSEPEKVSQEIQSLWDSIVQTSVSQCWTKNDQTNKRCYFGVPQPSGPLVLVLDYRNLSGEGIASSPPVHISFTGKMIASDLTRKWTRWNVPAYSGELMYHPGSAQPVMTFGSGGITVNSVVLKPQVYTLNAAKYTDSDFGVILSYYVTYFFVSHEMEQALQVGSHRHDYSYVAAFIEGIGVPTITPYACTTANAFPSQIGPNLQTPQGFDLEFDINVTTSRCAFKISVAPLPSTTDAYFNLQKLIVNMKKANVAVRGTNTGTY